MPSDRAMEKAREFGMNRFPAEGDWLENDTIILAALLDEFAADEREAMREETARNFAALERHGITFRCHIDPLSAIRARKGEA